MKNIILDSAKQWGHNIPENDFNFGINLLHKRFKSEITMDEFLKECTYFMLKCGFDELRPKILPTRPQRLLEWDSKRRPRMTNDFWHQLEVKSYTDQKWKVIQQNFANKSWLKENLKRLEQYDDVHYAQIVRDRLQDFEEWEQDNYEYLKIYYKN